MDRNTDSFKQRGKQQQEREAWRFATRHAPLLFPGWQCPCERGHVVSPRCNAVSPSQQTRVPVCKRGNKVPGKGEGEKKGKLVCETDRERYHRLDPVDIINAVCFVSCVASSVSVSAFASLASAVSVVSLASLDSLHSLVSVNCRTSCALLHGCWQSGIGRVQRKKRALRHELAGGAQRSRPLFNQRCFGGQECRESSQHWQGRL